MMNAYTLEAVEKHRDHLRVGPLNVEFPNGCVTAIVGVNGSGKSTMLSMMIGLAHPDQGNIYFGQQIVDADHDYEWKQRIGYLPEQPNSEDDYKTPDQLATVYAYWYKNWDWQIYQTLMAKYEIPPRTRLNKMSKGMRRKCELIMILSYRPDVLLLDEPSSGLDPVSWRYVMEDLQKFMDDGERTIIIATHIIDEVRRLADYIMFLHRGQLVQFVEKDELFDAWKEYWFNISEAVQLKGAPGIKDTIQDGVGVRIIVNDIPQFEVYLQEHDIQPVRVQTVPLDEIMVQSIKGVK
ncbi:ATP-binding cassette domain-containing protein [Paenibacillus sp. SC116]|uniref:ATP-binding cassette domain-containing protein n=1 Tax=Paenibacillus sp. SC116 TaxID=2968986 RepID=UPI00215A9044|nr:ABC transporter ATP-binding protein [Paenibacillus sp. SC116]